MKPVRILIADDHQLVLSGIKQLLEQDFQVVGTTTKGRSVMGMVRRLKPDVVLLDVAMPDWGGFRVARALRKHFPALPILFVTMHQEPPFITKAFQMGVKGYVLKHNAVSELKIAIRTVLKNRCHISTHIPRPIREQILVGMQGAPTKDLSGELTARQKTVFCLLAQGLSTKAVSRTLKISPSCVAFHKANIKKTLGFRTMAGWTRYAVEQGYIAGG